MLKKVAIIIPFYKDALSAYEHISLQQCAATLTAYPVIAVKPNALQLPKQAAETVNFTAVVSFDDSYFNGVAGYNRLMLSAEFYNRFMDYEYVLIYQTDAFVFKDELADWCNKDIDYIGAPWIRKTYHKNFIGLAFFNVKKLVRQRFNIPSKHKFTGLVGNGGFSLRRVKKFYDVCLSMRSEIEFYLEQATIFYNEDIFWGIEVNRHKQLLHIADYGTALNFAFEVPPKKSKYYNRQNLPFGCHAWDRYTDFWRPLFKLYNYHI